MMNRYATPGREYDTVNLEDVKFGLQLFRIHHSAFIISSYLTVISNGIISIDCPVFI